MTDPSERLLNLAKALSDGEEIDWQRVEAEAQDEEERELLTLLRKIGKVAQIHRTERREAPPAAPLLRSAGAVEKALHAQQELAAPKEQPLPLEVRVIARVARIAVWLGGIFWILVTLGFITSTALNVVLGRPREYAPEIPTGTYSTNGRDFGLLVQPLLSRELNRNFVRFVSQHRWTP